LEKDDKAYERNKYKRPRIQGRNPLPRRTIHTNSIGTQTKLLAPLETTEIETQIDIPTAEETTLQTEGVFPIDFPTPLESIDIETQVYAPTKKYTTIQTEEAF
jgi:hypothetical protein